MSTLEQIWQRVSNNIIKSNSKPREPIPIPAANTDRPVQPKDRIESGKSYFLIRINQLFLSASRKWFTNIEPMVFAVSEFHYAGQKQTVPYVVGPKKESLDSVPHGMIFKDTAIAGPHPYRGGALTLSVVLSQMPTGSPARKLLGVVEKAGQVFDVATTLGSYVKVGNALLDGVETILGLDGTRPLIGWQQTIEPNAGDVLEPGYIVQIDADRIEQEKLWVKNNQLYYGATASTAQPFRDTDFVLISIASPPDGKRNDIEQLPFIPLWHSVLKAAGDRSAGAWDTARANLATLATTLDLSPDLTGAQKDQLIEEYIDQAQAVHHRTLKLGTLAGRENGTLGELHDRVSNILTLN